LPYVFAHLGLEEALTQYNTKPIIGISNERILSPVTGSSSSITVFLLLLSVEPHLTHTAALWWQGLPHVEQYTTCCDIFGGGKTSVEDVSFEFIGF
jgi:hypothetical protein